MCDNALGLSMTRRVFWINNNHGVHSVTRKMDSVKSVTCKMDSVKGYGFRRCKQTR